MYNRPQAEYKTTGNTEDETLEKLEGFQWRRRESLDGEYVSFRITWGKPDAKKGKNEFYIGWTLNEQTYMRLSFFQFRAGWFVWSLVLSALTALGYGGYQLFHLFF